MQDSIYLYAFAWFIQALGFGFIGDDHKCGFLKPFLWALISGPFVALAVVLGSPLRKPQ